MICQESSHASCNVETIERGLRLLEFATFNNLVHVLTNTLGPHKPSNRWTWQSQDRKHHSQINNNILVRSASESDQQLTFIGPEAFLEQA